MEEFLVRGWDINLPVRDATSTLARVAPLATRWLHNPQPISNQLGWLGVRGSIDPGDPRFRPQVIGLTRIYMEEFLIRR